MKKRALIPVVCLFLVFSSCYDAGPSEFSPDPDPIENPAAVPGPAEDLYIVANVAGKIAGFRSSAPEAFVILTGDASTEPHFSEIRISADLKHLLYARETGTRKDLVLLNLESQNLTVIAENIQSNESEFIDDNSFFYSDGGSIRVFNIETESEYVLVPHQENRCNHWAQISPDLNRIVFKDQDATSSAQEVFFHAWSPIELGGRSDICNEFLEYQNPDLPPVDLYESFYYNWRDNKTIIFKNSPGVSKRVYEKNVVDGTYSTHTTVESNGAVAFFEKLLISPDKENLLLYGDKGLYRIDLVINSALSGTLEIDEVYRSPLYNTKYAAFGSGSLSFVVGTPDWMGVYNTEGLERTSVSIENVIGEEGTLYALHCR